MLKEGYSSDMIIIEIFRQMKSELPLQMVHKQISSQNSLKMWNNKLLRFFFWNLSI